jgi:hypothetical protein
MGRTKAPAAPDLSVELAPAIARLRRLGVAVPG